MKDFLRRYKYYLIAPGLFLLMLLGVLILASLGEEDVPFIYQIF